MGRRTEASPRNVPFCSVKVWSCGSPMDERACPCMPRRRGYALAPPGTCPTDLQPQWAVDSASLPRPGRPGALRRHPLRIVCPQQSRLTSCLLYYSRSAPTSPPHGVLMHMVDISLKTLLHRLMFPQWPEAPLTPGSWSGAGPRNNKYHEAPEISSLHSCSCVTPLAKPPHPQCQTSTSTA